MQWFVMKYGSHSVATACVVAVALLLGANSLAKSSEAIAPSGATDGAMNTLLAAYNAVHAAEQAGASASQVRNWSAQLNTALGFLEEANQSSSSQEKAELMQSAIANSTQVLDAASAVLQTARTFNLVEHVVAYGAVIPASFVLAYLADSLLRRYRNGQNEHVRRNAIATIDGGGEK